MLQIGCVSSISTMLHVPVDDKVYYSGYCLHLGRLRGQVVGGAAGNITAPLNVLHTRNALFPATLVPQSAGIHAARQIVINGV